MTTTAEVAATTELVARPLMGGQGVDVLDAEWQIDRKGGFTSASIDVVPPKSISRYADDVNEPVEIRDANQHGLWEGRVAEPDIGFVEADRLTIEATGYSGCLSDDEYFRRCYVDGIIASWETDQCTKYADRFTVGIEDDDKLVMRVSCQGGDPGQTLHDGMNCRAYWQLFDGIPTTQSVKAFKTHYQSSLFDLGSLVCKIYGRDKLSGGAVNRLLWTSPAVADDDDTISLDAGDIGDDVTVLVPKLYQVGETITEYTDLSAAYVDEWALFAGIAFDDLRVYASDLGANVTPERIVRDAVLTLVDDDHIDFPDVSGYVLDHADFSDPTTVGQLIEDVNQMLDWNYGFDDGQVFYYRKPWTAATVPLGELIVTSFVDPNLGEWGVRRDWQDCCNKVVAHYTKKNGRVGSVTVSDAEGPLGSQWKTKFLDLTDTCNSSSDATLVATQRLRDGLWPKPTGSIVMKGDAHLACGLPFVPVVTRQPGTVPGAVLELHAAKAALGVSPGINSPLTTRWFDASGNGNHGTLAGFSGTPWAGAGTPSDPYRLVFPGGTEGVRATVADLSAYAVTAEAWVSFTTDSDSLMRLANTVQALVEDGCFVARMFSPDWSAWRSVLSSPINDGLMHHVAVTFGAQWMELYVDGTYIGHADILTGFTRTTALGEITLGYRYFGFFDGDVSLARIYPFALTPEQVAQNYAAGTVWPVQAAASMDVPAIYLRPGMMLVNLDVPPEKGGRMLVTSVAGRLVAREITLEVGTRSTRLDRLMARRELGAKRRPRRKAKR